MKRIVLDAGHGGTDPGSSAYGVKEKDVNLEVVLRAKTLLSAYDVDIQLSRSSDITLSKSARLQLINNLKADLVISCHHNSSINPDARGVEVWHSAFRQDRAKSMAEWLAQKISYAGLPNRGAKTQINSNGKDYHYMIRQVATDKTTAIIVEGAFISHAQDAALMKTLAFLDWEANAIAAAAVFYLGLEKLAIAPGIPEWQQQAFQYLIDTGIIVTPEYWAAKLGEPITIGEVMSLMAKIAAKSERS